MRGLHLRLDRRDCVLSLVYVSYGIWVRIKRWGRQNDDSDQFGYGLAEKGIRTVLVDLDPQANATSGLGLEKHKAAVCTARCAARARRSTRCSRWGPVSACLSFRPKWIWLRSRLADQRETIWFS